MAKLLSVVNMARELDLYLWTRHNDPSGFNLDYLTFILLRISFLMVLTLSSVLIWRISSQRRRFLRLQRDGLVREMLPLTTHDLPYACLI